MKDLEKAINQLKQALANMEKTEDKLLDGHNFEEYDEIEAISLTVAGCIDKINGFKMRKELKEIQNADK